MKASTDQKEIAGYLDTYDWKCAFGEECISVSASAVAGASCNEEPFRRSDVVEIIGVTEGENDGDAWRIAGRLADGRWFYLNAWCDYTGWDCQAGGHACVADDRDGLIQFGIPNDDCDTWGLS